MAPSTKCGAGRLVLTAAVSDPQRQEQHGHQVRFTKQLLLLLVAFFLTALSTLAGVTTASLTTASLTTASFYKGQGLFLYSWR